MIELDNVSVVYKPNNIALNKVSLKIEKGEFVFLTGDSGAGKTTLMKLLYASIKPTSGRILVNGEEVSNIKASKIYSLRRQIGIVFQDFKLLQNRTVFENIAITLEVLGVRRSDIVKRVNSMLKQVDMFDKADSTPQRLSGGEQQRVALARALVNDPKILIADEPTGNLDDANKNHILNIFRDANVRGTTVLLATHDHALFKNSKIKQIHLYKGAVTASAAQDEIIELSEGVGV